MVDGEAPEDSVADSEPVREGEPESERDGVGDALSELDTVLDRVMERLKEVDTVLDAVMDDVMSPTAASVVRMTRSHPEETLVVVPQRQPELIVPLPV